VVGIFASGPGLVASVPVAGALEATEELLSRVVIVPGVAMVTVAVASAGSDVDAVGDPVTDPPPAEPSDEHADTLGDSAAAMINPTVTARRGFNATTLGPCPRTSGDNPWRRH